MTIRQAIKNALEKISSISTSALLDAEVLLCFTLKKDKTFIYTYPEKLLTAREQKKFQTLVKKRSTGVPVAYLVNEKEFYGLKFSVNKHVLIPRPETELLVENTLLLSKKKIKSIVDIGTGSGAVAISLAKKLPQVKVIATDNSPTALQVAEHNAKQHQAKIDFRLGNLLEPLSNQTPDIIVTNLPYVPTKQKPTKKNIGLKFEPQHALYSGLDGLNSYRKFFSQLKKIKTKPRYILIEHGEKQRSSLYNIIKKNLKPKLIITKKDLSGLDRLTIIEL